MLFIGFVAIPNVHAQFPVCPVVTAPGFSGSCAVSVSPASLKVQSTSDLTFTVSVMINNVANISTYDLWFNFNQAVLTANSIGLAPAVASTTFWCQADCGHVSTVVQEITQGAGTVHVVQGLQNGGHVNIGSSALILFSLNFTAKSVGTAALTVPKTDPTGFDNPKIAECPMGPGSCTSFTAAGYSNSAAVVPPFGISMAPGSLSLAQGGFGTATFTLTSFFGFIGNVNLAASGSGTNTTLSVRTISLAAKLPSVSFAANIEAQPCTAPGSHNVGITGTSGTMSDSNTFPVVVTSMTVSSFCISANTNTVTITPGSSSTVTISVCSANGFSGTVGLSAEPVPIVHHRLKGVLASGSVTLTSANDCTTGTAVTTMLTIDTTSSLAPNTYALVVTGSIAKVAGYFTVVSVVA